MKVLRQEERALDLERIQKLIVKKQAKESKKKERMKEKSRKVKKRKKSSLSFWFRRNSLKNFPTWPNRTREKSGDSEKEYAT